MMQLRLFVSNSSTDFWDELTRHLTTFACCNCYNEYRRSKTVANFMECVRSLDISIIQTDSITRSYLLI